MGSVRSCLAVLVLGLSGGAAAATAGVPAAPTWHVAVGSTATTRNGVLTSVDCSGSKCESVGGYFDPTGTYTSFAEGWSSNVPTLQALPDLHGARRASELLDVTCRAPRSCEAVGSYDGRHGSQLPLGESWNGHHWSPQFPVAPQHSKAALLSGVACSPTGSGRMWCLAVGSNQLRSGRTVTFGEVLRRGRWSLTHPQTPSPNAGNGQLRSVACATPRWCVAVGDYLDSSQVQRPLAEVWSAGHWQVSGTVGPPSPGSATLTGVSCPARGKCASVGWQQTGPLAVYAIAESLSSGTWSLTSLPAVPNATTTQLAAVECRTPARCLAVGNFTTATAQHTLAERFSSSNWRVIHSPNRAGQPESLLSDVACARPARCVAVGNSVSRAGVGKPLAETWDGQRWAMIPVRAPHGAA